VRGLHALGVRLVVRLDLLVLLVDLLVGDGQLAGGVEQLLLDQLGDVHLAQALLGLAAADQVLVPVLDALLLLGLALGQLLLVVLHALGGGLLAQHLLIHEALGDRLAVATIGRRRDVPLALGVLLDLEVVDRLELGQRDRLAVDGGDRIRQRPSSALRRAFGAGGILLASLGSALAGSAGLLQQAGAARRGRRDSSANVAKRGIISPAAADSRPVAAPFQDLDDPQTRRIVPTRVS
jgi:hypothetical protein